MAATQLKGFYDLPPETKGGVFGTAAQICSPLANADVLKCITKPKDKKIKEFIPENFVKTADSFYALSSASKKGTATSIITALTVHILEAAENYALTCKNSRLPFPMFLALDEVANVVKWKDLPEKYSFYRKYGIVMLSILQDYAQGVKLWRKEGMQMLFDNANINMYLGNVVDEEYNKKLTEIAGKYEITQKNKTFNSKDLFSSSTQRNDQEKFIYEISDFASWPLPGTVKFGMFLKKNLAKPGRAFLFGKGYKTIIELIPYFQRANGKELSLKQKMYEKMRIENGK